MDRTVERRGCADNNPGIPHSQRSLLCKYIGPNLGGFCQSLYVSLSCLFGIEF